MQAWLEPLARMPRTSWRWLALAAMIAGLLAAVKTAAPGMVGGDDGYYHLKLAALMRADLTPRFTWLPLTILLVFIYHHLSAKIDATHMTVGSERYT